ncbi:MAG TPA: hypothetical protein ENN33_05295, partial [Ignavibacteria bacterium]|nr:hypothetical protein [Ignavibacteria bacterium]
MNKVVIIIISFLVLNLTAQENRKIVDLTYAFDENTIFWPTQEGFQLIEDFHGMTEKGYFYSSYG